MRSLNGGDGRSRGQGQSALAQAVAEEPAQTVEGHAPVAAQPRVVLGENISQGDLVRLMISPGTKVSEGQPVMELETDKAVVEVPSSVGGIVKELKVKEGEKIKVGQVIFTLEGGAPAKPDPSTIRNAPVEHVSGQHGARLAFQAAIRAEGKTEEQALPPDHPHLAICRNNLALLKRTLVVVYFESPFSSAAGNSPCVLPLRIRRRPPDPAPTRSCWSP